MRRAVSHIDEGQLHAWLDGDLGPESGPEGEAIGHHLAACDECRMRLEEARALRESARSVLASADHPSSEAPAFAEIVARARAGARDIEDLPESEAVRAVADTARSRIRRRTSRVGLAWAASITLAMGAGWLGRELTLQRGLDLPDALDVSRRSTPALTEDETGTPERFEEGTSVEPQEGLRRDLAADKEPNAAAKPTRQKSEAKLVSPSEAEESRAGRGEEVPNADMLDRVDAELAEVAAPSAEPTAAEAVGQARDQDIAPRARFAVRPLESGSGVGHPAVGCWRADAGREVPGAPARIRLTDEQLPGVDDGSLRLETDPEPLTGSAAAVWMPLGADSVWISVPPRVLRLAQGDSVLDGLVMVPADPAAVGPSEVRYTRVECQTP
jgi:hypothetical protein